MTGCEGTIESDGAAAGAAMDAIAGLRMSLCGARLWDDVAAASKLFETDPLPAPPCPCVCEKLGSCASAAEINGLDSGAIRQVASDTGTTAAIMVKNLLNR